MEAWMWIVIASVCIGLGFLLILLTTQHLEGEIAKLTQSIEELERELLHKEEEQPEGETPTPRAEESQQ
jgi:hypothetical protein